MGIDHPCGGMIFSSRVHRSPASIRKADYVNVRIECELAVKLGHTLSPAPRAYTRDSVRPAVSDIMAAFELIEDRHANYKTCKALSLIADNALERRHCDRCAQVAAPVPRTRRDRRTPVAQWQA